MRCKTKITKRDIIVGLGCLVFLLLNLGAFDERGRAQAKKMVCLTNVRKLADAWLLFAKDNDDILVNGAIGFSNQNMPWGDHTGEVAWVSSFSSWNTEFALRGISDGALWPYLKDFNIYRCPAALTGEMLTYSVMFSMNAVCHPEVQRAGVHVKKLTEIQNPEQRLVFIDEGRLTPDAFAVYFRREQWWDGPPIRHSDGTTVSFADGHSEHWKWKGTDTVRYGWETENSGSRQRVPETEPGFQDLYRMQKGCWGTLGYSPSYIPQ